MISGATLTFCAEVARIDCLSKANPRKDSQIPMAAVMCPVRTCGVNCHQKVAATARYCLSVPCPTVFTHDPDAVFVIAKHWPFEKLHSAFVLLKTT
jgi:hypothetical protein